MNDPHELSHALAGFTGTDQWYRHGLNRNMLYTDGVLFFADNAGGGAYWFLDIVATELMQIHKTQPFMTVCIDVANNRAALSATDGNDNELWSRNIDFTDCPTGVWNFYLADGVFLLTSEY